MCAWCGAEPAVDRVGNDYPRLIALSHPTLTPSSSAQSIRRYSQQFIDLIDLQQNRFTTLPVKDVLNQKVPQLRFLAQLDSEGYFQTLRSNLVEGKPESLVLTFDELLRRTDFPQLMRELLATLESEYHTPVDIEFTARVAEKNGSPKVQITLIQCRPLGTIKEASYELPQRVAETDKIFSGISVVAGGMVEGIRYVLYVRPSAYFAMSTQDERSQLERAIGKVNAALHNENYICVGPGRWGTSNPDLGVHVDYADIFNARAIVELTGGAAGIPDEPSLGTHFFQDLLEGQIYPLAVNLNRDTFNAQFFESAPNRLLEWLPGAEALKHCLRVIRVADYSPESRLDIVIDDINGSALAFLSGEKEKSSEKRQIIVP